MTPDGHLRRTWAGEPPNGENMGKVFALSATQAGRPIPIDINYDKIIWSGLSWAVGEIRHSALKPGVPVLIQCSSAENDAVVLEGKAFEVSY